MGGGGWEVERRAAGQEFRGNLLKSLADGMIEGGTASSVAVGEALLRAEQEER